MNIVAHELPLTLRLHSKAQGGNINEKDSPNMLFDFLSSCAFRSGHSVFLDGMNAMVVTGEDPAHLLKRNYLFDKESLQGITKTDEYTVYHFKYYDCYYDVFVDKSKGIYEALIMNR